MLGSVTIGATPFVNQRSNSWLQREKSPWRLPTCISYIKTQRLTVRSPPALPSANGIELYCGYSRPILLNSTAVIIGAMVLAPLMAPIVAIAMGLPRSERTLTLQSLKTIGIGVGLSLLVSALLAIVVPVKEITPEIAARLQPTLLDLGVAIACGIAGAAAITFLVLGYAPVQRARKGLIVTMAAVVLISVPLAFAFATIYQTWQIERAISNEIIYLDNQPVQLVNIAVTVIRNNIYISADSVGTQPLPEATLRALKADLEQRWQRPVALEIGFRYRLQ